MAHERVRYYDVKASVREVKATRIACPELDTICEAFLPGKTPRRFRQAGTEINADDPAGKTRSTSNRPGGDPGSAAHIEYCARHVDVHDVEIFLQHLRENWMFGPRFKSRDDDLEKGIIELVGHSKRVSDAH